MSLEWPLAHGNSPVNYGLRTQQAVCMFMDMDKMLGAQFEKGLASMKEIVEAGK